MNIHLPALAPVVASGALIVFILYRRIRRSIGRQKLAPRRMGLRIGLLALVCAAFTFLHPTTVSIGAEIAGAIVGIAVGLYALKHTQLEVTEEGKFYTPHPYISLGVVALFIGRIAYRLLLPGFTPDAASPAGMFAGIAANPITLGLYFVMASYYICFYAGVLRKAESLSAPS
ncbi:MAG: hypothetical protein AB7I36_19990 [Rhodospirillaceae bacterium]